MRMVRVSVFTISVLMLMSIMAFGAAAQSEPDPNATVDIVGLSLSCEGIVSFSTVVNVSYERFDGGLIIDIYEGDPFAGGEPMLAAFPSRGDDLLGGTTAYTEELIGSTVGLADPYVQVRWTMSAWDGPSALDHVGDWSGAVAAPMDGSCGEPFPSNELVQTIIRIILEILGRVVS